MDAETENLVHVDVEKMEEGDVELDNLLHKAVTVSQVNLPLATIDRDIDDIAISCCEDPSIRSTVGIDKDVMKLIERTRQRRQLLNEKMGKTPEAAPRKRRTPLMEDLSDNVNKQGLGDQPTEDSPKRQCVREDENQIKPDTPAIPSVRSRLQNLASQRYEWADTDDQSDTPVPAPRKSLSSPPDEKPKPAGQENVAVSSIRKSRFAQLAQNINTWEDDLSHPTITKEEEKKPRWQPPKPATTTNTQELSSAKKGRAPPPPTSTSTRLPASKMSSPKKTPASTRAEEAAPSAEKMPTRSASRAGFNSSPKPFKPYEGKTATVSPVKSPACSKANLRASEDNEEKEEATKPSVDVEMRKARTPLPASKPADRPLSSRLANWEQKISESAVKQDVAATPKSGLANSAHVGQTPKQVCTPARPQATPARDVAHDVVQMRPRVRKSVDDEPTAHSVSARMSAWEQISSANEVSGIKKVRPGDCTPVKTPGPKTPANRSPSKAAKPPTGATPGKTPAGSGTKSFQDSIKERASQVNPKTASGTGSPQKGAKVSPSKASPAMKSVQQRLVEQTQSTDMAQRLRQERMAELQAIQNRWKNGILRDDGEVETEEPPIPQTTPKAAKKEVIREKARADGEDPVEDEVAKPEVMKLHKNETAEKQSNDPVCKDQDANLATDSEHTLDLDTKQTKQPDTKCTMQKDTESRVHLHTENTVQTDTNNTVSTAQKGNIQNVQNDAEHSVQTDADHNGDTACTTQAAIDASLQAGTNQAVSVAITQHVEVNGDQAKQVSLDKNMCTDTNQTLRGETEKVHVCQSTKVGNNEMEQVDCVETPNTVDPKTDQVGSETVHVNNVTKLIDTEKEQPDKTDNVQVGNASGYFENKLSSLGFDVSDEGKASFSFKDKQKEDQKKETSTLKPPPVPAAPGSSQGKPAARPTSLFNIVSQKKSNLTHTPPKSAGSKTCRKVKFDDSFESDDSEATVPKKQALQKAGTDEKEGARPGVKEDMIESDTTEDAPTEVTEDESEFEVELRRPRPDGTRKVVIRTQASDDDDLSLSAFVPASVRRQSILPSPKCSGKQESQMNTSLDSVDSFEGVPGAPPDIHKSTVDLVRLGKQHADSSSSLTSQSTADSSSDLQRAPQRSGYSPDETEESVDERDAIGDLLDEAMDSEDESTVAGKPPMPRKRHSHMMATRESSVQEADLPFSLSSYRASRTSKLIEVKQTITRNSQYAGQRVQEEDIEMPTQRPAPVSRQTIQERVKELQELIQQEQNVIMQTSNALNQCCANNSYFAGSAEQVECNRLLLIACQKRQSYMTEIQRLRETGCLDNSGAGPKGSLTISDIRLPLKKDFVTKIGTSHDNTTFYFILLLRNGPQLIVTQMLSTHDPMMRGSLDFPNLIKINGITGSFKLNLEIYCMSVSRELTGKDKKKKKTPKKVKGSSMTVQSPGGPMAVHTTSFTHVTSVPLTMKSLDKHSFQLERLSYLSPLHGTIYMNLKCLMEASVEEKGFLTMFEDVSGLGSWHRRWCVLGGNKLSFWKYPDDEMRKDPMGYIDLKRCVTEKVGLIARDICARPHTFELMTVRQPRKGERDTLISRTYNTMTTIRHMLSADTKEERIVWCNKLNRALANIRTWNADAMRPIHK